MPTGLDRSKLFSSLCLGVLIAGTGGLYGSVLQQKTQTPPPAPTPVVAVAAPPARAGIGDDELTSAARLDRAFLRIGYRLDAIRDGEAEVPPLFLERVPHDLDDLPDPERRKALFLRVMLPLVLAVNAEIAADRAHLEGLLARKAARQSLTRQDRLWLTALAERYDVEDGDTAQLLARVDEVPPSLALAQAAEETGWGTSRLVRRSRNLFGLTGDDDDEPGMRRFGSLKEGVQAYLHTLNTHPAYAGLRRARQHAHAVGRPVDGHQLADSLSAYSERGKAYVGTIRSLIRRNDLVAFDRARLAASMPLRLAAN